MKPATRRSDRAPRRPAYVRQVNLGRFRVCRHRAPYGARQGQWLGCRECRAAWWVKHEGALSPKLRRLYARTEFLDIAGDEYGDPVPALTSPSDYAVRLRNTPAAGSGSNASAGGGPSQSELL